MFPLETLILKFVLSAATMNLDVIVDFFDRRRFEWLPLRDWITKVAAVRPKEKEQTTLIRPCYVFISH
jgi:hypothetical protein